MSADNAANVAVSVVATATIAHLWTGFCPDLYDVGSLTESEIAEATYWIHRGEAISLVIALALGVSASYLSKSYLPFLASIGISGYMIWTYENALRNAGSIKDATAGRDDA